MPPRGHGNGAVGERQPDRLEVSVVETTTPRADVVEIPGADDRAIRQHFDLAAVYVALGRRDDAFKILNRGVDERDEEMMYMKVDPRYDPVRADPRFARILARLDLR